MLWLYGTTPHHRGYFDPLNPKMATSPRMGKVVFYLIIFRKPTLGLAATPNPSMRVTDPATLALSD
jgi:hypothetical protein